MHSPAIIRGVRGAAPGALLAGLAVALAAGTAQAQSLTVLPVNLQLAAGQSAATMSVINQGTAETSVQIRALAWTQSNGKETLEPSDAVLISPPIATIPPSGTQVVRLVLRHPQKHDEATYRIILDQIPPPAAPGTVRIALRLSIPVFAEPDTRALPHVTFHVEKDGGDAYLVATNNGGRHETISGIKLTNTDGSVVKTVNDASPYVLAGATRRWRIEAPGDLPAVGAKVHLIAQGDTGIVDKPIAVQAGE